MTAKPSLMLDALDFGELHTCAAEHYIAACGTIALEETLRVDDASVLDALEELRCELTSTALPALSADERGDTSPGTRAQLSAFILACQRCVLLLGTLPFADTQVSKPNQAKP